MSTGLAGAGPQTGWPGQAEWRAVGLAQRVENTGGFGGHVTDYPAWIAGHLRSEFPGLTQREAERLARQGLRSHALGRRDWDSLAQQFFSNQRNLVDPSLARGRAEMLVYLEWWQPSSDPNRPGTHREMQLRVQCRASCTKNQWEAAIREAANEWLAAKDYPLLPDEVGIQVIGFFRSG